MARHGVRVVYEDGPSARLHPVLLRGCGFALGNALAHFANRRFSAKSNGLEARHGARGSHPDQRVDVVSRPLQMVICEKTK